MEQIPIEIYNILFLSRFKETNQPRSYVHGYLTRSDGNRLSCVNKWFRNMILANNSLFSTLDINFINDRKDFYNILSNICKQIVDVSILGNVHTLNLSNCAGITDVSNLGNVHTLDLSSCYGITDVSMLGNVHTLILNRNYRCKHVG